jgi:hypothetical protein
MYSLPNIVRVVKSRRKRWAGHVARMGEGRGVQRFWWGSLREQEQWGGFLITHNDTPQSVGILWTSDQSVTETST